VTEAAWKQRLFDWEKRDRCLDHLRRHLRACRFSRSRVELLVSCSRDGQAITDNGASRSLLTASKAQVARLTGLSPTAIHKAKEALVAAGLLRYTPGHYLASWSRVWDLCPPPDPVEAMITAPDEGRAVTTGHHRSPPVTAPRQEPKKENSKYSKTQLQENQEPKKGAQLLLQEGNAKRLATYGSGDDLIDAAKIRVETSYVDQVERTASRIMMRARACEHRCKIIDPERRLKPHTARALARCVASLDHDALDEFQRLLDYLDTHDVESTGGCLVSCFKKRGWWRYAKPATV